jgi:hypothetical protein
MKNIIGLLAVVSVLAGCETSASLTTSLVPGTVLGWHNHLYKVVSQTNVSDVGQKLGEVTYHGQVAGAFTVFELQGTDSAKAIVFESSSRQYFKAIVTNEAQ